MARRANTTPTETLLLSTTPQVVALLDKLARAGLHGKNPNEVAEELVRLQLREAIRVGDLAMPSGANRSRRSTRKRS
jgi:hypothetical protein